MSMPARVATDFVRDPDLHILGSVMSQEYFREIFVGLGVLEESQPVIAVTSAVAGEGRTTVALGLAETLAGDLDSLVTLVDADFDRPAITQRFDMVGAAGLSDLLRSRREGTEVGSLVSDNLRVVPAGTSSEGMGSLLRQIPSRSPFRLPPGSGGVTVLDLPPLLSEAYSSVAAQSADAIVLVVRAGCAPADSLREAISRLEDTVPRGVVFIGAPPPRATQWLSRLTKGRRRNK